MLKTITAVFIFIFLLIGCQSPTVSPTQPVFPTLVALQLTQRKLCKQRPFPTITPQATNTAVPTAIPTLIPSATPTPSPVPTTTPIPCKETGRIETGVFPSIIAGEMKYRVYLPPCYGQDGRTYPALYVFGGNTHTDSGWDDYGLDEALEAGIQAKTYPPFIIVMPDNGYYANNTSGGPTSYEGIIINDLIPFIEATYCVWADPAGRALGGVSRGGYWSLEIAFRQPEMFVSVGGHSSALIDRADRLDANPQYTGINNNLGDLRIYMDVGKDDWLRPNFQRLHEDMLAKTPPVAHEWVLNEGIHEDAYWISHLDDYLAWYAAPWSFNRSQYPACTSN